MRDDDTSLVEKKSVAQYPSVYAFLVKDLIEIPYLLRGEGKYKREIHAIFTATKGGDFIMVSNKGEDFVFLNDQRIL